MRLVLFRGLTLRAAALIAGETTLLLGAVAAAAWLAAVRLMRRRVIT